MQQTHAVVLPLCLRHCNEPCKRHISRYTPSSQSSYEARRGSLELIGCILLCRCELHVTSATVLSSLLVEQQLDGLLRSAGPLRLAHCTSCNMATHILRPLIGSPAIHLLSFHGGVAARIVQSYILHLLPSFHGPTQ